MLYILIIGLLLHIITLIKTPFFSFYYPLQAETYFQSFIDIMLTLFFIFIFYIKNKYKIKTAIHSIIHRTNISKIELFIFYFFLSYSIFLALQSGIHILNGATRQDLITKYNTFTLGYLIVSSYFKVIFPYYLIIKIKKRYKLLSLIGLISCLIITASRNELIYSGFLILTLYLANDNIKNLKKILYIFLFFSLLAVLFTVIQGRPITDGIQSLYKVLDKHLIYRSYSLYLSEITKEIPIDLSKYIYPFTGYFIEKFFISFNMASFPIDNNFISHYEIIGLDPETRNFYYANVLYPWWSWFFIAFGYLGFLIKSFYIYFLLAICLRFRLILTFFYMISIFVYTSPFYTPLITLGGIIAFSLTIIIDLINIYNFNKVKTSK